MDSVPKIFVQFASKPNIEPKGGDTINEVRFYRSLSTFADVYYNDHLIKWDGSLIGHPTSLCPPSRDYDLYYVRANTDLLERLPSPKISMAYPYSDALFANSDAILVTTEIWKELLLNYDASPHGLLKDWYPKTIVKPNRVINIQQSIDPMFEREVNEFEEFQWRARTTGARVFGFFGRITDETIPHHLVKLVSSSKCVGMKGTDPIVAFAGSIRTRVPLGCLDLGHIPYPKLPPLLSICTATLGQQCADSRFLGSGKVLDSMARGVPIVSLRNSVREEQLGSNYAGLFDTIPQAAEIIERLCVDEAFRASLVDYLNQRRALFRPAAAGSRLKQSFVDAGLLPA